MRVFDRYVAPLSAAEAQAYHTEARRSPSARHPGDDRAGDARGAARRDGAADRQRHGPDERHGSGLAPPSGIRRVSPAPGMGPCPPRLATRCCPRRYGAGMAFPASPGRERRNAAPGRGGAPLVTRLPGRDATTSRRPAPRNDGSPAEPLGDAPCAVGIVPAERQPPGGHCAAPQTIVAGAPVARGPVEPIREARHRCRGRDRRADHGGRLRPGHGLGARLPGLAALLRRLGATGRDARLDRAQASAGRGRRWSDRWWRGGAHHGLHRAAAGSGPARRGPRRRRAGRRPRPARRPGRDPAAPPPSWSPPARHGLHPPRAHDRDRRPRRAWTDAAAVAAGCQPGSSASPTLAVFVQMLLGSWVSGHDAGLAYRGLSADERQPLGRRSMPRRRSSRSRIGPGEWR